MTTVRKGQAPDMLGREEFRLRFYRSYYDPAFQNVSRELAAIEEVAWDGYINERKSPVTEKAGPGFADPDYDLSIEWRENRDRLLEAERRQKDAATPSRVLLICASALSARRKSG